MSLPKSLQNFRTYQLATEFYRACKAVKLPHSAKDQLTRASMSICLNLAEGSAKSSPKDKHRFYEMAFASTREVQALIHIESLQELDEKADQLAAHLYRLKRSH